jgi:hypothetical protein
MTTTPEGLPYNSPPEAQFEPRRLQEFIITRLIRGIHTVALVKVLAVRPTSGKVGFLDVQPLVLEQDTAGKVLAQSPIYNVPYFRYQGGVSAVILDPAVGDIGLALACERDIRSVKATQVAAPAGSDRVYNSADSLYIGGVLNPDPTQWVKFLPDGAGIDLHTPGTLTGSADGNIDITTLGTARVSAQGTMELQSGVSITLDAPTIIATNPIHAPDFVAPNASLNTHKHDTPNVQGGSVTRTSNGPHN